MVKPCVIHSDKHPIDSQKKSQQQEKASRHYSLEKKDISVSKNNHYFPKGKTTFFNIQKSMEEQELAI